MQGKKEINDILFAFLSFFSNYIFLLNYMEFANILYLQGTELTFDYNWCKVPGRASHAIFPCLGSKNCTGIIGAKKLK